MEYSSKKTRTLRKKSLSSNKLETPSEQDFFFWKRRFFQIATLAIVLVFIYAFTLLCGYFNEVASIIGYSILISYLLIGVVDWIHDRTPLKQRGFIVAFVYLAIALFGILFCLFVIPNLIDQLETLASQVPRYFKEIQELLIKLNVKVNQINFPYRFDFALISQEVSKFVGNFGQDLFNHFVELAFNTINFAIATLATIVISIYFLIDGPRIWSGATKPLSDNWKLHANNLRKDVGRCLRGYFVGQIQLSSISGIYVFFMYLALGSKYALLLAIWQAIVEIIPVVGGFIGIGLGIIVLLFNPEPWFGLPFAKAAIAFIAYISYTQFIKDNLLTPRIMGNAIGLHPVLIILVVLIGAKAGGVTGVIFALPMAGFLNVILDYYLKQRDKTEETQLILMEKKNE